MEARRITRPSVVRLVCAICLILAAPSRGFGQAAATPSACEGAEAKLQAYSDMLSALDGLKKVEEGLGSGYMGWLAAGSGDGYIVTGESWTIAMNLVNMAANITMAAGVVITAGSAAAAGGVASATAAGSYATIVAGQVTAINKVASSIQCLANHANIKACALKVGVGQLSPGVGEALDLADTALSFKGTVDDIGAFKSEVDQQRSRIRRELVRVAQTIRGMEERLQPCLDETDMEKELEDLFDESMAELDIALDGRGSEFSGGGGEQALDAFESSTAASARGVYSASMNSLSATQADLNASHRAVCPAGTRLGENGQCYGDPPPRNAGQRQPESGNWGGIPPQIPSTAGGGRSGGGGCVYVGPNLVSCPTSE